MTKRRSTLGQARLRQDADTPLTTLTTPFGTVLVLYARSGDSVSAGTVGQDYVAYRYGESNLSFVVCDGVGQSFMGDLAARILGDGLTEKLWDIGRPANAQTFAKTVTAILNDLTKVGAKQVADFKLPAHLPPIVVQALEMQRQYGSESMFVAGRIDLSQPDPWVALCWLGDSPVAAIDIDGKLVDLGPRGHTSERWNALSGVKGEVHAWVGSAERVARVAGYTDGLGINGVPVDADLVRLMKEWQTNPPADDASLFDVRLAPSTATTGASLRTDDSRPIRVEASPRVPVTGHQPIEAAPPEGPIVGSWRPLMGEKERPTRARNVGALNDQIRMWQQAALLGLTSAALAMLMVERLLEQQAGDDSD